MRPGRISLVNKPIKRPRQANVIVNSGRCNHPIQFQEVNQEQEGEEVSVIPENNGRRAIVATGVARNPFTGALHQVYRPVYRPVLRPVYPVYG